VAVVGTQPFVVSVADVCFCHRPVDAAALARAVPDWLTVETAAGSAWLTAIPHTVTGVRAFGVDLARPAEAVTVRTYVRGPRDQRGLYFFAVVLDAALAAAVTPVLRLPVRRGRPERSTVDGRTRRTLDMDGRQVLDVSYPAETNEPSPAPADSLAAFLVERDRFFTAGPLGGKLRGDVGHDPWSVAGVDGDVSGSLSAVLGLPEPEGEPLCHYSPGNELSVAPPSPVWLSP
jgi:uncharacterized protein YqjF (DUF2071 family)